MNNAIVYIRWSGQRKVWLDKHNTTLLSIATIRHYNRDVPIYVFDTSDKPSDYGDYPKLLDFQVSNWQHRHPFNQPSWCSPNVYRCLSRPFDLRDIADSLHETQIMYCDSDLLWLSDPVDLFQYLEKHGVATTSSNSGLIVFDKFRSTSYFNQWQSLLQDALQDERFREKQSKNYYSSIFNEETSLAYLNRYCTYWQELPSNCNYQLMHSTDQFDAGAKNYHFICYRFDYSKSRYILSIQQFYEACHSVLGDRLLDFGSSILDHGSLPVNEVGSLFLR